MPFISVVLSECVQYIQERKRKKEEAASAKLLENEKRNKVRKGRKQEAMLPLSGSFLRCLKVFLHQLVLNIEA